jgi:hypothetical protein
MRTPNTRIQREDGTELNRQKAIPRPVESGKAGKRESWKAEKKLRARINQALR